MNDIEKRDLRLSLFECYSSLLTSSQKEVFSSYYAYDLSLGEIAESRGISRSAVEDMIEKTSKKLEDYEKKLGLKKKKEELLALANKGDIEALKEYLRNGI
jgi:predicted DNA-binding protein YlxM (UPF0122 family)